MGETRAQFNEYITRKETQLPNPGDNQVALHNLQVTESITRAFLDMYPKLEKQPLFDGGPRSAGDDSQEILSLRESCNIEFKRGRWPHLEPGVFNTHAWLHQQR